MTLRELAFDIGRKLGKHRATSRIFCLLERALPLHRLGRSQHCVAFDHPRPSWQPHILIVPTTPFPALSTDRLTVQQKSELIWEMVMLARTVTRENDADWRMVINGGKRQDIGQVHGHLIHADREPPTDAIALADPAVQPGGWEQLFARVRRADAVPGNGYSTIFRLLADDSTMASLTHSASA